MLRVILMSILVVGALHANSYKLNKNGSEAYYKAKKEQFFMTFEILGLNKQLSGSLSENKSGYSGSVYVNVNGFDSDSGIRDEHVREDYLHAKIYPQISYLFTINDGIAKGEMRINGVSKTISFPVSIEKEEGSVLIAGNVTIKYSDFNIPHPSNLVVDAHKDVTIGAMLRFEK